MPADVAVAPPGPAVPEVQHISGEVRLSHDGWVSEFEAFQSSAEARNASGRGGEGSLPAMPASARSGRSRYSAATQRSGGNGSGGGGGSSGGNPSKTMDNLRAEIKLLHWHKLANEAALKAALLKTKKIKAQGGGHARPVPATSTLAMPIEERAVWMQQVIEEEQSKPLQVTKHFMSKYEEQEKLNEGRLDSEVAGHIRSLRNLRKQIEEREAMKDRKAKYRAAQERLKLEKKRLLQGKLQPEDEEPESAFLSTRAGQGQIEAGSGGAGDDGKGGVQKTPQKTIGALNTVLGSLDKLVELEKRITSLENSNVYDDFRATKQGGVEATAPNAQYTERRRPSGGRVAGSGGASTSSRTSRGGGDVRGVARRRRLSFSKQRTEATVEAPSQVYYAVRVRNRGAPASTPGAVGTSKRSRPGGAQTTAGVMRGSRTASNRSGGGAGTFLTQLPDVHRRARVMGSRKIERGGSGAGVGFRSAIAEKKRREAKRKIAGRRAEAARIARQDGIIREWLQRKKAAAAAENRLRKSSVSSGTGAGSVAIGRRTRPPPVVAAPRHRTNNPHLQEFRDIRAQYAKRTDKLRRDLSRRRRGSQSAIFTAGTQTPSVARPRAIGPTISGGRFSRHTPISGPRRRDSAAAVAAGPSSLRPLHQPKAINSRPRVCRARGETGLAVGGMGLQAARAGRQQGLRMSRDVPGYSGARRSDVSWRQRDGSNALPRVGRVGRVGRRGVGRWASGGR